MLLASANGTQVELQIDGYRFFDGPAASVDGWDENWLTISGRVNWGAESWAFRDPCLTTWEAQELLAWLRSAAAGTRPDAIDFTEPILAFEVSSDERQQSTTVLVTLRGEAASPSIPEDIRWDGGSRLALDLSPDALADAARAWEDEVGLYPSR